MHTFRNSKWLFVYFFIFIACVLIVSGVFVYFKSFQKSSEQNSYRLGSFLFLKNTDFVHSIKTTKTDPQLHFCVDNSDLVPIGNLTIDQITHANSQGNRDDFTFHVETWNNKKLAFSNEGVQKDAQEFMSQLNSLKSYTDEKKLAAMTLQKDWANDWSHIQMNIDPWPALLYCADSPPKIPIFIQQIPTDSYDKAFYAEYFVSPYGGQPLMPSSELIVNKGDDWLIVDGEYSSSPYLPSLSFDDKDMITHSSCGKIIEDVVTHYANNWPTCAAKDWNEKYRDQKKIDEWVSNLLKNIQYQPQGF